MDSTKLSFLVDENFKGSNIKIDFDFVYTTITELENHKKFLFSQPANLVINKNIDTSKLIVFDKEPPEILIYTPDFSRGIKLDIKKSPIDLKGKVIDKNKISSFTINEQDFKLNSDGSFNIKLNLINGDNDLILKAIDSKNHIVENEYTITYKDPDWYAIDDDEEANVEGKGVYYALIIGVDEYQDMNISSLDKPIADGIALKNILVNNYTFEERNVTFLKNPTREQIIVTLDDLSNNLTKQDNLIIFYAGHGYWDENKELGYWLPADSRQLNTANWLRNSTLRDYIKAIDANHTLLIADACFSGGIFKTRKAFPDASKGINRLYSMQSRKAMTSGTLKEVPDKSVFLQYLLKRLKDNTKKYIASEQLFASFKEAVMNNSENIPQFGTIQNSGDEGGDFIFIRRDK